MNLTIPQSEALRKLNPSVVTIRGDIAYDQEENVIEYDLGKVNAKAEEMQAIETAAKTAALTKLTALGLTQDDLKALIG